VKLARCNLQTVEENPVVITQSPSVTAAGPRIERCKFENLLERAMEILSARAKSASSPRA
jgi:hypothetical protein